MVLFKTSEKPHSRKLRVAVITSSDSCFARVKDDVSGSVICKIVSEYGYNVVHEAILPEIVTMLYDEMKYICDNDWADLILATVGTGFTQGECLVEVTQKLAECMLVENTMKMHDDSMLIAKHANPSRVFCGIRKSTVILILPGNSNEIEECLSYLLPELEQSLNILIETANNC